MDDTVEQIPAPTSMEEVEKMIQTFYTPLLPASTFVQIQRHLLALQRSPDGWKLAEFLLQRDDATVQFFGANTYLIKINNDWNSLDEASAEELESQLVRSFIALHKDGKTPHHVLQKLSTALALYYVSGKLENADAAVKTLVCSTLRGEYLTREQIADYSTSNLVPMLDRKQLQLVLSFVDDLAVEARKFLSGYSSEVLMSCAAVLQANISESVLVIHTALSLGQSSPLLPGVASICDLASAVLWDWASFAQSAWPSSSEKKNILRSLVELALIWCSRTKSSEPLQQLQEMLEDSFGFFKQPELEMIAGLLDSEWANSHMEMVLQGDPDEETFIYLLVAYGQRIMEKLVSSFDSEIAIRFMDKMHAINTIADRPGIDEEAGAREALPFWTDYVDWVTETWLEAPDDQESDPPWLASAKAHVRQVCDELWPRTRTPSPEELRELDSERLEIFKDFRRDVKDLWEETFRFLGEGFLSKSVSMCLESFAGEKQDFLLLEAALFLTNALADEVEPQADPILDQLFASPLFSTLSQSRLPQWTCRTALETITSYSAYFTRHSQQLPSIFEFLFVALRTPVFAHQAATSIYALCDKSRESVTTYLERLFQTYETFLTWDTAKGNHHTKSRFTGAIACIIQALPSQEERLQPLLRLLAYVQADLSECVELSNEAHRLKQQGDEENSHAAYETSLVKALEVLNSLKTIGKGLQAPDERGRVVDLEGLPSRVNFWLSGDGASAQKQILAQLAEILQLHGDHDDVVELSCDILKAGFPETEPGPFVFPADTIVDFVQLAGFNKPGLLFILAMAQAIPPAFPQTRIDAALTKMVVHLITIMKELGDPRTEPEVTEALVRLLSTLMPKYTNVIFNLQPQEDVEILFRFIGTVLTVPEPLPKRTAAGFWSQFLAITPNAHVTQQQLDAVLAHFAPSLAAAFMSQVAGEGMRSDMEHFTEPIRRFLTRIPNGRALLDQALASLENVEAQKEDVRRKFLQQLVVARNSTEQTRRALTEMWSRCKGVPATYVVK